MARRTTAQSSDGRIVDIDVSDEMRGSFLEYAYSVIYARALPDARDGLKPVQRRILFQMSQMGLRPDRGHVKSARVVGEVMGRLHPHGDSAIYDALVRMAQPFTLRLPLIDGHGNFGSLDDGPAAMRYTEARLDASAIELTSGLDEDVVDFSANYDGRETEPTVLPAAFPNLLVNGAAGIAVGMATTLVPHNLGEVMNAARHLLLNPSTSLDAIMKFIPGPDLPGGGVIVGVDGIKDAYATGRGSFRVRARTRIEQVHPRRKGIVVTELPYNVGPERVIDRIKDAVQSKKLQGIADVVDLTDGESGLHLVIEIKNGFHPEAILDQLFKMTPLEESVAINAVALVGGQPATLGLVEILQVWLDHRHEVVRRRSEYRRARAQDRLHLVEGLVIAIVDIDEVIQLIRQSDDTGAARERLMSVFDLSEIQANYILEMPLRRLTKFSRIELEREAETLQEQISALTKILENADALRDEIVRDIDAVSGAHATPRRTLLLEGSAPVLAKMPLEEEDSPCLVLMSTTGLIARTSRNRTLADPGTRSTHDAILCLSPTSTRGDVGIITSTGRLVRVHTLDIPTLSPGTTGLSSGAPLGALVDLAKGERAVGVVGLDDTCAIALATEFGIVKRVQPEVLSAKDSWEVIRLEDGDRVVAAVRLPEAEAEAAHLVFVSSDAQMLHFPATAVRPQGRAAGGMVGMRLYEGSRVIAFGAIPPENAVVVTQAGSSAALPGTDAGTVKVTALTEYPTKGRATTGVRAHKLRAGEDQLTYAWIGPRPARASSPSGTPLELPAEDARRDGTGTPLGYSISTVGGAW